MRNKLFGLIGLVLVAVAMALIPSAGAWAKDIDIKASDYGYGEYLITARGTGYGGAFDEDKVVFYYYPVYAEAKEDESTGAIHLDLDYNVKEDEELGPGDVAKIVVNVYDGNGNLVDWSPITVYPPTKQIELPFNDKVSTSGTYTIEVIAYDKDGNMLYKPFYTTIDYEVIPVPNTGTILGNLNISKTDYLITGLIIFFIAGAAGLYFVNKRGKSSKRKR